MTKAKKPKIVVVGNTPTTPVSVKERRRIKDRIKRKYDQLRRKYKAVRGKRVDWIDYSLEEHWLYVNIHFTDRTSFHLMFEPQVVVNGIELNDWKSGDAKILKTYYLRQDL
jgi:hypothetical protein